MALITTSSIQQLLYDGIKKVYGLEYDQFKLQFPQVFDTITSDRASEKYQEEGAFGLFQVKAQGQNSSLDDAGDGYQTVLTNIAFSLGFDITHEAEVDDRYNEVKKYPVKLARSAQQTKETVAANIFNNGFDTNYPGADGQPLFSLSHLVTLTGVTFKNRPTNQMSLTESALKTADTDISRFVDAKGMKIMAKTKTLVVPRALSWTAKQLLNSDFQAMTANNAINPIKGEYMDGYQVMDYLSSDKAWFIRTNVDGLVYQMREDLRLMDKDQVRAYVHMFVAYYRCAFGWYDPRSVYGTSGV